MRFPTQHSALSTPEGHWALIISPLPFTNDKAQSLSADFRRSELCKRGQRTNDK
ncbi:hypothetical protein [uncultured Nostoc sp.]|uniref:hypothetical protein n=1 Tax=uncultured Nostoc sp. TaxID=340711 RepID=UPI0035CB0235